LYMLAHVAEKTPLHIHALTFRHGLHEHENDMDAVYNVIGNCPNKRNVTHEVVNIRDSVEALVKPLTGVTPQTKAQVAYASMYQHMFAYAQHFHGITVGTTNQTEVGFIGWFGKNSDMMVDIQ